MSVQVALLRAVNVGGTGKLPMADLRALAEKHGLKNVRTLLQSGNLVFDAGAKSPSATEKLLEAALAKALAINTNVFVRTPADLQKLIAENPFPEEAKNDPGHLHVLFMRDAPMAGAFAALQAAIKGREIVKGLGRHAYITYPDGAGESKLTAAVLARHLGSPGTARNWNTVLKLQALVSA